MAHKLGTMVCKGARYGVVTQEERDVELTWTYASATYTGSHRMIEVTWVNGIKKGEKENIFSYYVQDVASIVATRRAQLTNAEDRLSKANAAKRDLGL